MSNPLKKVVQGVKKVFKKAVEVVKKVVASKLFKVVLIAAAIYFTAGAAAGYFGAAGAAGAAGTTASFAAPTIGSFGALGAGVAETGIATGIATTAATVAPAAISTVAATGGMTVGQGLLASAVLQTGGNALSAYAQGEKEKDAIKTLDKNGSHNVDVYGMYAGSMEKAGQVRTDANGKTVYGSPTAPQPAIQQVANVDARKPSYYNGATDSWTPVQRIANANVAPIDNKAEVTV